MLIFTRFKAVPPALSLPRQASFNLEAHFATIDLLRNYAPVAPASVNRQSESFYESTCSPVKQIRVEH